MRTTKYLAFVLGLLVNSQSLSALENKLSCSEADAIIVKCTEYDTINATCDTEVSAIIKTKIQEAKTALDECKKKNSFQFMMKCKKEIKNSSTAINTPTQVASRPIHKELVAKSHSACAKAETLGNTNKVCQGPKKVLEAMKSNCIKDSVK